MVCTHAEAKRYQYSTPKSERDSLQRVFEGRMCCMRSPSQANRRSYRHRLYEEQSTLITVEIDRQEPVG
jgi:hypothetical protein